MYAVRQVDMREGAKSKGQRRRTCGIMSICAYVKAVGRGADEVGRRIGGRGSRGGEPSTDPQMLRALAPQPQRAGAPEGAVEPLEKPLEPLERPRSLRRVTTAARSEAGVALQASAASS